MLRRAAVVATVGLAVFDVVLARQEPLFAPAGTSVAAHVAAAAAGIALAFAARDPWLLAAALCWVTAPLAVPGAGSAPAFTAGLLAAGMAPALAAFGITRRTAARALLAAAVVGGPLVALVTQPSDGGCSACPRNLVGLTNAPAAAEALTRVGASATLLAAALLGITVAHALVTASRPRRRRDAPMATAVMILLAGTAAAAVQRLVRGDDIDVWSRAATLAQAAGLAAIAGALTWAQLVRRRRASALAAVSAHAAASPAPGGLQAALADALGDPTFELHYDDRSAPIAAGRERTVLAAGGRRVAVAEHRAGLLEDPALADALADAAGLALEHEALTAELAAQLGELQASRARVVAAGDAERRRLEQDLHDGAQQRLASLALNLQLVTVRDDDEAARVRTAQEHLRAALGDLRELAHGIFPRALADSGLGTALEDLAEEAARPLHLNGAPPDVPPPIAATAYLVVASAASRAGPPATVTATMDRPGQLVVVVEGEVPEPDRALLDRVDALGGTLDREPRGLRLEVPCAS